MTYYDKHYKNIEKYDNINVAIDVTVKECLDEGILEKFLKRHMMEVKGLMLEYSRETHMKYVKEEGREEAQWILDNNEF